MEEPIVGEWTLRLADGPLIPRIIEAESYAAARGAVLAMFGWKRFPPYTHLYPRHMQELRFVPQGTLVRLRDRRWGIFTAYWNESGTCYGFIDLNGVGPSEVLKPFERVEVILAPVGCARSLIQLAARCKTLEEDEDAAEVGGT